MYSIIINSMKFGVKEKVAEVWWKKKRCSLMHSVSLLLLSGDLRCLARRHLMPALHGPLPPLEQKALLSVRLLHVCRNPSESLHNLPAILMRDTETIHHKLERPETLKYN